METSNKHVEIIVAVDNRWAIGADGNLLYRLSADMRHFKSLTMGHTVVMGRRTFESLPHGPLAGRQNIVLTRDRDYLPGYTDVVVAHTLEQALRLAEMPSPIMIIGGAQIYKIAMNYAETLHITMIHHAFADADVWFPTPLATRWTIVACEAHRDEAEYDFDFVTYKRL